MSRLLLLSRDGCCLCERFIEAMLAEFPQLEQRIEVADVDSRAGWQGRWGSQIPVLLDDEGTLICATEFDAEALRAWPGLSRV